VKLVISVALSCAIVLGSFVFGLQYISSDPSTEIIDQDIAAVERQISSVESEQSAYGAGAIQSIFQVRVEILKTTLAMLEQKRVSALRRIDLNYTLEGERHTPDEAVLASLAADKKAAEEERDRFVAEAARYSGGLIQTLAVMKAATSEMAIVQADLAIMSERYGFLIDMSSARGSNEPVTQNIVQDEEAL